MPGQHTTSQRYNGCFKSRRKPVTISCCYCSRFYIYIVKKAKLTSPRFHLILLLSLFDLLFAVNGILYGLVFVEAEIKDSIVISITTTLGYIFNVMSLQITIFITVDRLLAVKYSLRYYLIINNKVINIVVTIAAVFNTLVSAILLEFGKEIPFAWRYTRESFIFINVMRLVTVLVIIIIGKITLIYRNRSENAIKRQINIIHGQRAEKLTVMRTLQRSVKDMMVLNFWTCVFLAPVIIASLLYLQNSISGSGEEMSRAVVLSAYTFSLSNPFVYVLSQAKLKKWLVRRYRMRIGPETTF